MKCDLLKGKVVAGLGAGCGLPALAAALYCEPKAVYVTDIHRPTLDNAVHNRGDYSLLEGLLEVIISSFSSGNSHIVNQFIRCVRA